ncbi:MAG: hypothetical protein WBC44_04420 [Planctomycetaceae bacterium]
MTRCVVSIATAITFAIPAVAQLPETRLGVVFPPGGRIGTTFEVRISGEQDLEYEFAPRLVFSHPGISAEPIVDAESGHWQNNAFRVTAAADVPPGRYDVSLLGYYGASSPRSLLIDRTDSLSESIDSAANMPMMLTANTPYYGRIGTTADVDAFTFSGTAGATIVVRCDAAALDSPLQPIVEIVDPAGHRMENAGGAFGGDALLPIVLPTTGEYHVHLIDAAYRGGSDYLYRIEVLTRPVVVSVWPPFGQAGTEMDVELHGYNLPEGEPVESGRPLVRRKIGIAFPADGESAPGRVLQWSYQAGSDGFADAFRDGDVVADAVPVYLSPHPPEFERENDGPIGQEVTVPMEIAGRFEKPLDVDHYVLGVKTGEVVYVEAFAKRYGSPADPVLKIDQIAGPDDQPKERRIVAADDMASNIAPGVFDTASDDPALRFEVPEDGRYRITVRDRYSSSRGDASLCYRLSLRRPKPDFRLFVVPHSRDVAKKTIAPAGVNLRKGENVAVPVYVLRRDGFSGPVRVTTDALPEGLSTLGATIGEGRTSTTLVLTASAAATTWQGPVTFIGEAVLPGADDQPAGQARRVARIGTIVRGGANQSTESRLAGPLVIAILEESLPFRIDGSGGVERVGQGSQVLLPLDVIRRADYTETITVTPEGLPGDAKVAVDVKPFAPDETQQFVRLVVDPQAPARSYSIVLNGTAKVDYAKFPYRLARAKASQERAVQALDQSNAAVQQAVASRDAAVASLKAAETTLQAAAGTDKPTATAAVEAARTTLIKSEAAVKNVEKAHVQADAAKKASDAAVAAAEKAASPQKIDVTSPAPPVALTVVPAPAVLSVAAGNNGQLKRGDSVEITVSVTRQNGFAGPVQLSLATPPNVRGLAAEPVTIDAAADEAILRVTANGDAAEGDAPFLAVRAEADHNGVVRIDVPLTLKIIP